MKITVFKYTISVQKTNITVSEPRSLNSKSIPPASPAGIVNTRIMAAAAARSVPDGYERLGTQLSNCLRCALL